MGNNQFGAKEVFDVTLYDMTTNLPVIFFDSLKTSAISVTAEKVYARGGKGNPKLITWETNKEATLKVEDALLSPKSMSLISGVAPSTAAHKIYMRQATEYDSVTHTNKGSLYPLTASQAGAITLAFTPNEAAADIIVYEADDDTGTRLSMSGATLSGTTLTIAAAASKHVVVYYSYNTTSGESETYVIDASHFAGTYKMVGDTVVRNRSTGKDEAFQLVVPNLKWTSNLELGFSADGDPATTSFDCDIMQDGTTGTMIEMTRY